MMEEERHLLILAFTRRIEIWFIRSPSQLTKYKHGGLWKENGQEINVYRRKEATTKSLGGMELVNGFL